MNGKAEKAFLLDRAPYLVPRTDVSGASLSKDRLLILIKPTYWLGTIKYLQNLRKHTNYCFPFPEKSFFHLFIVLVYYIGIGSEERACLNT